MELTKQTDYLVPPCHASSYVPDGLLGRWHPGPCRHLLHGTDPLSRNADKIARVRELAPSGEMDDWNPANKRLRGTRTPAAVDVRASVRFSGDERLALTNESEVRLGYAPAPPEAR